MHPTLQMTHLAVLLTVHNRKEATLRCLRNLQTQQLSEGVLLDVYLTNDGCTDGTPEAVKAEFPEVKMVQGNGHLFWNRGMHTAWEAAAHSADYDGYIWLNDDTFVYPQMVAKLLEASALHQHQAIIVGPTQSLDHTKTTYGGRPASGKIAPVNGQEAAITHFNGNIVFVPLKVYSVLGNLDPYFAHSKGDFDYGLRAKKKGIPMFQVGEHLGECDEHPTLDKWCNPETPFLQRCKLLYRPNGMPPHETFHLERRHCGFFTALFHFVTVHVRCVVPGLWVKLKK